MKRGEVVIVEFPYVDGRRGKNRPALVVQNDRDNRRLANTVVAMISGNVRHANEPTQVLVDPSRETAILRACTDGRSSSARISIPCGNKISCVRSEISPVRA